MNVKIDLRLKITKMYILDRRKDAKLVLLSNQSLKLEN